MTAATTAQSPVRPATDRNAVTCAVIVCTYSLERLADLEACLDSIERQTLRPDQTIVVVDHNDELAGRIRPTVTTIPNAGPQGLSFARNSGLAAASSDIAVFIDDDAVADPDWLHELVAPFADPAVAAVGGRIEPNWPGERPAWFPPHLDWTVGCTNPGLPAEIAPIRNVFGASAAFRRNVLQRLGGFPVDLGRVGADVAGCEETQVCIRIRQTAGRNGRGAVVCAPRSLVHHRVTPDRARVHYVLRRCLGEGQSKARLAVTVGDTDAISDERAYSVRIARAVVADVVHGLRRPSRIGRAAVLATGLACAAAGYAAERAAIGRRRRWG